MKLLLGMMMLLVSIYAMKIGYDVGYRAGLHSKSVIIKDHFQSSMG